MYSCIPDSQQLGCQYQAGGSNGRDEHVKLNYYLKMNQKCLIKKSTITVILITSYSLFLWTHTFFGSEEANNKKQNYKE